MNGNDFTNVDTISSTIGVAMNINGDDNLSLSAGGDLNITGDADVYITSSNNNVFIEANTGLSININTGGINLSAESAGISISTDINLSATDDINIISSTGYINANNSIKIINANDPLWNTELSTGGLFFIIPSGVNSNNIILDAEGGAYIGCSASNGVITNTTSMNPFQIQFSDETITTTLTQTSITTNDNFSITQSGTYQNSMSFSQNTGDIIIQSANGSVEITAGNGDAGNSGITLTSPEGNISLNPSLNNFVVCDSFIYAQLGGFNGPMYHSDNPTASGNYYLTFVQSGGVSGYYIPNFDSATLTYNPSTNLLSVAGLQLSGATNTPTFSAGVLTLGCNESSSRQFQFGMTADITGLSLTNRRTNGVYTCSLYNVSGSTWTISNVLTGSASNKTDYLAPISVANGEFAVLTARTLLTNGTAYNYVSVVKFS